MLELKFLKSAHDLLAPATLFTGLGIGLLFALGVEIDAFDITRHLMEADVVKPLEARPTYRPHTMVWDKEVLFPAHE